MLKICAIILTFYSIFGSIKCELGFESGYQLNVPNVQFGYDNNLGYSEGNNNGYTNGNENGFMNDEESNGFGAIPGTPGEDYPIYAEPPETSFKCQDHEFPGYYADPEAQCQVFHICQTENRIDSFLCPNGTLFNQQYLVCDWWNHVDCDKAEELYSINESIFREMQEASERLMMEAARRTQGQGAEGYDYTPSNGVSNRPDDMYLPSITSDEGYQ